MLRRWIDWFYGRDRITIVRPSVLPDQDLIVPTEFAKKVADMYAVAERNQ